MAGRTSCHLPAPLSCQAATRVLFTAQPDLARGGLRADDLALVVAAARQRDPGPGAARVAAVCLVRAAR